MASNTNTLNVLVADDNPHMRMMIVTVLKGLGFRNIRQSSNGAEALGIMRDWQPDLAIVDYNMEPVNGVEFTCAVRDPQKSANPYLTIIMLTGYADRKRVVEARDAGVNELIVKPLTARALVARLNAVVNNPRAFIQSEGYLGPCRRRTVSLTYNGPERRQSNSAMRTSA